ncbi:hypothetical protein Acr_03g0007600 [Actinidia rufa]|uniref:SAUR-like auxin-responsive protein family n=1 Tax=Actinidia rufa TaxID=165716 RepID=A0A7J0ECS2_9ERIC|nr:hypothetical protein Acr_03g0007600 [Actinidia rufa]
MGQPMLKFRSNSCFVRVHRAMKHWQKGFLDCHYLGSKKVVDEVSAMGGHFPVLAISNGRVKKFLVALNFLAYPPFVKLLEAAEQEFGFDQPGVLVIPCEANELQRILLRRR